MRTKENIPKNKTKSMKIKEKPKTIEKRILNKKKKLKN